MCRMLAFASQHERTLDDALAGEFRSFALLSKAHKDGWGTAEISPRGTVEIHKAPKIAFDDPDFWSSTEGIQSRAAFVHLRWATGTALDARNTHPFLLDGMAFCHNGLVKDTGPLERRIPADLLEQRRGESDSEVYFLALLSAWRRSGDLREAVGAVTRIIREECGFSGINFLLLTQSHLHVFEGFDPSAEILEDDPHYYELHLKADEGTIAVASSGWAADAWPPLQNGDLVSVNLQDLRFETHSIAGFERTGRTAS